MKRISIPAIALSSIIVLSLDIIGSTMLLVVNSPPPVEGASQAQMNAVSLAVSQSTSFLLSALVYGSFTTVVGGYLAAKFAKKYPYFNAAAFGLTGIVLGLFLSDEAPFWFDALSIFSTIPAALFGGHQFRLKKL